MRSLRALFFALLFSAALFGAPASAQSSEQVEGTTRLERPEEGLRRGLWSVPSWVPVAGGVAIFVAAAVGLAVRFMRKPKP